MAIRIRAGNASLPLRGAKIGDINAVRRIRRVRVRSGGATRTVQVFADPLTVSIQPNSLSGFSFSTGPTTVTSDLASAIPSGGFAPFSYAWTQISGDPVSILSSTQSSARVQNVLSAGETSTGIIRVTVTDATGSTAQDTADFSLFVDNFA